MPRPLKARSIQGSPRVTYFKPRGIPTRMLETVTLGLDELEAMRLADLDGLYQQEAAKRMGISRPTFGRLVAQARAKVADALFHGKALVLEGGTVCLGDAARFECGQCGTNWVLPAQSAVPGACGSCGSAQIRSTQPTDGTQKLGSTLPAGGRGQGRGRGCGGQGIHRRRGGLGRGRGRGQQG